MASILRYALATGALLAVLAAPAVTVRATEPTMAEYTHYPLFQTETVDPRIMIALDNSGSMNFPAYGYDVEDWPNQNTLDAEYDGRVCREYTARVSGTYDDGMEQQNTGQIILCSGVNTLNMLDLDLGKDDDYYGGRNCKKACACRQPQTSAVRFADVTVPREVDGVPVVISNAYIEFTARSNNGGRSFRRQEITLKITAEAADSAAALGTAKYNISSRPDTSAEISWTISDEWSTYSTYTTPDLKEIVQEIISRPGWNAGQAIVFKIDWVSGDGGRVAYSFDGNATRAPRLVLEYEPCEIKTYYGYFNPKMRYTYSSSRFVPDPAGDWDGNFLNFLCMRRGDILKKAVVGGRTEAISGSTNVALRGITDSRSYCGFRRHHVGSGVSPWADAWYFMDSGNIEVRASSSWSGSKIGDFVIRVEKDRAFDPHADFGPDGLPGGVMQKVGDRAAWGNAWFLSSYSGNTRIYSAIGTPMASILSSVRSEPFETSTPLAESLYVVTQYFKQENPQISGYPSNAIGTIDRVNDPFYDSTGTVEEYCAQGFCMLLTDGMSTSDTEIPNYLKNYAGDGVEYFPSSGTSYARDVALYMNTTDLRSATVGRDSLPGDQNVILYVVYALGNDDRARDLLKQSAKNGGFVDRNGSKTPDLQVEWDKNGDNIPDNYFEARDGAELEQQLMTCVLEILARAGSGTAVSVLATKGEGEGTLVQAIFEPSTATELGEVTWRGHVHSLWVDSYGKIREDTDFDHALDTDLDDHIVFGREEVCDSEGNCEPTGDTVFWTVNDEGEKGDMEPLDDLRPIWSAGDVLAETDPYFRHIYTYKGDGTEADPHVNFVNAYNYWTLLSISNFMGINDNTAWGYLGPNEIERAFNLILWSMGVPDSDAQYYGTVDLRERTLSDGRLWKLGDIIHSTPTSMAQPLADYDLLYNDMSYYPYYMQNRNRETVVFVGSNSGMLHAFTGWVYHNGAFVNPYDVPDYFLTHTDATAGNVEIGTELWAYIPQNLLPHLKWLPDPEYTHVNYIDLRPRVFDAQIFEPSAQHPNGWGTVLVCGFGFAGGMPIPVNPDHPDPAKRTMTYPAFFAFDVTEPRAPIFLWERAFPGLGMSSNYPNLMKVEDQWLLAIGSGPTSMDGDSVQDASLIVVDLKTGGNTAQGGLKNTFTLPGGDAFCNEPVTFDKNMNYNVDAVYVAANYTTGGSEVFRLTVPQKDRSEFIPWDADGNPPEYVADPADPGWTLTKLFKSPRPITSSGTVSVDRKDNTWLYLGTGRYLSNPDKANTAQNYIIGIKDPFFNPDLPLCNFSYPAVECEINSLSTALNPLNDLFDADVYTVYGRSKVESPDGDVTFDTMLQEARRNVYQGWFRSLLNTTGEPSERVVNKGAVLGGILLMPTYLPNSDPCKAGGESRLFAVYYETGTAFFRKIFAEDTGEGPIIDVVSLGEGIASSLSIHSGRQAGGKVYIQKSTGEIMEVDVEPAFKIKSGPEYWLDDGYY